MAFVGSFQSTFGDRAIRKTLDDKRLPANLANQRESDTEQNIITVRCFIRVHWRADLLPVFLFGTATCIRT